MVYDRYKTMLAAIEHERKSEEKYYAQLSTQKSISEKVEAGILLTHLSLEKRYYTVGEYIELKFQRTKNVKAPHKFKVGTGCQVIVESDRTKSYRATVSYRKRDRLGVILSGEGISPGDFPESIAYKLELIYDERPYKVMVAAVKNVMSSKLPHIVTLREGIRKKESFEGSEIQNVANWHISNLINDTQSQAVQKMLAAQNMGIIHGPPGTGKTTTLVALVETLLQNEKRILVCGPSNNAVDLLARRLHQQKIKVVRIGNVTRIDDEIIHLTLAEKARNHPDWGNIKKVKIESEQAQRMAKQHKRSFGHEERRHRKDMYRESRELRKWARDLEDRLLEGLINDSQVICTTLIGVTSKYIEKMNFTTVIIDEASQALEPECWNAILRAQRVILAGDPMQLSPTVKSTEAASLDLSTTLLDRMTSVLYHKHLLTVQYRMNAKILAFSNKRFYQGELTSAKEVIDHQLPGSGAIVTFIDTSGCGFDEEQAEGSRSHRNEGEYFIIREHLIGEIVRYKSATIGIISPYAEQIRYISQEISEDEVLKSLDITVNTIDGFQGQERDAIIISLVRSNDAGIIGFVADERRLNVAMTRARKRLVIVGDVATLGNSQLYLDLVDHIEKKGEYRSAWEYMS